MKKFIAILFAAVAFAACNSNKDVVLGAELSPSPNKIECKADGGTFTITTAIPSYFTGATIWEEVTEENPTGESSPLYYSVTQRDATTYEVKIKPFEGEKIMYLSFGVNEESNAGLVAVNCRQ